MHNSSTRFHMLRETAHALSGAFEEQEVIQSLLTQTVSALDAQGALVRLLSPDGDELLLAGALGLSETYLQKGPVGVAESQVDQHVLAGEVVVIPDVTQEPGFQYPEAAAREGLRGMVAVALSVRGRPIGVLRVYVDEVDELQSEDLLMLSTLADLGALALEKVRLHQSLYRIAEALNTSLASPDDLEAMMQKASLVVSLTALGLMGAGFIDAWVNQTSLVLPGEPALPLPALLQLRGAPAGLVAMSAGIVLLALLPAVRVLLALALYVRRQSVLDALAGLVVLLELLTSMRAGG